MSYYWFNTQETLQKTKEKYSKEKPAEYNKQNKEDIKEKSRKHNARLKSIKKKYQELGQYKKDALKNK